MLANEPSKMTDIAANSFVERPQIETIIHSLGRAKKPKRAASSTRDIEKDLKPTTQTLPETVKHGIKLREKASGRPPLVATNADIVHRITKAVPAQVSLLFHKRNRRQASKRQKPAQHPDLVVVTRGVGIRRT